MLQIFTDMVTPCESLLNRKQPATHKLAIHNTTCCGQNGYRNRKELESTSN